MLRICLAFYPIIKFITKGFPNMSFNEPEVFNTPVVSHQQVFVLKWVTVGFGDITDAGGTNMGHHAIRSDPRCQIAQVAVVPCRVDRHEGNGFVIQFRYIPTDSETVSIEGLFDFPRMKALIDQEFFG